MVRVSAVFVAACMVLICASFGAVLHLSFGMAPTAALICAIVALTGFALCTITASRLRGRSATTGQVTELSRGISDLARQVIELGRRVAAMEGKVADTVERAEAATEPLTAEIGEIGILIKQLAESVSAHELALQSRPPPPIAASVRPARPFAESGAITSATGQAAAVDRRPMAQRRRDADAEADEAASGILGAASGFNALGHDAAIAVVREAIEANRIEFFLQPILTLPQRKVRFYEALARLRTADGELLAGNDFIEIAAAGGLMPQIDNLMLFRCVQVVRRLMSKNRDVGLFCNLSGATLVDAEFFPQFTEFMDANRAIAPALMFELTQATYRALGPLESESLSALMAWGFRFSMDHVGDLKFEPRDLADRGFRFVKVPASVLLNRPGGSAGDIHAADLSGLLGRFGIELIAEKIENENAVVDLLDYDVKFGQGYLFSQPRPVRAEVLQATPERAAAVTPAPAPPRSSLAAVVAPAPPAAAAPTVAPTAAPPDARLEALQRPTALAQIARAVVGRSGL
jgi:cyclic-di-GMP phosphodiesterase, flagellum assembly factor TipF